MADLDALTGLAEQATIFGYAIAEHYKAIWAANSPDSPHRASPYRYTFTPRLYGPDDDVAVTANNDTIYGGCALDLRAEPAILQVPAIHDRYFSIQLISGTTDDFATVGTRATGGDASTYLIAGPDWHGETPTGVRAVLRSPSRFAIAPARIAVSGADDLAHAAALGSQFLLTPLSQYLGQPAPPLPAPVAWPPFYDPRTGNLEGFFRTLSFMLQWHEFAPADQPALDVLASLGVGAGQVFERTALPVEAWPALEAGFAAGRAAIAHKADHIGPVVNGWSFSPLNAGHFGMDYLVRSATAWKYIYVQSAEEALYPTADVDNVGQQLDGASGTYVLAFPSGMTPPTRFFWSVTIYDKARGLLVRNSINRYSVGDRTAGLAYDLDGTLRICIQHAPPSSEQVANWLPAPAEPFYLCLRCYGPEPALRDGTYRIPPVEKLPH